MAEIMREEKEREVGKGTIDNVQITATYSSGTAPRACEVRKTKRVTWFYRKLVTW